MHSRASIPLDGRSIIQQQDFHEENNEKYVCSWWKGESCKSCCLMVHIVTMINIQCSLGFFYASVPATTSTFLLFIWRQTCVRLFCGNSVLRSESCLQADWLQWCASGWEGIVLSGTGIIKQTPLLMCLDLCLRASESFFAQHLYPISVLFGLQ